MVLLRRLVDLVLFRCGPQDLPGDTSTLAYAAAAYCIAQIAQVLLVGAPGAVVVQAILATALLGAYANVVLRLRRLPNRFNQTAAALFGAGSLITLLMLAPTHALAPYINSLRTANQASDVVAPSPIAALAYLVLGIWGLAIYSHIYRHALNTSIGFGVAVTIGFELVLLVVVSLF